MRTKRTLAALVLSATLATGLAGCGITGVTTSSPLTNYLDSDTVEFMQNWGIYTPNGFTYQRLSDNSTTYGTADLATMKQVHDALMNIRIGKEVAERVANATEILSFTLPSGKSYYFEFENHNLVVGDKCYEVSDADELWKLTEQIVRSNTVDTLAVEARNVEDATVYDEGEAPTSSTPSSTQGGTARSTNAQSSSSGAGAGTTGSGTTGAQGGTQDSSATSTSASDSGASSSSGAASDAVTSEGQTSESAPSRQWTEPLGETSDGRNVEVMVNR